MLLSMQVATHAILATIGQVHPNFTFIQVHSKRYFGQSPIKIDSNILILKVGRKCKVFKTKKKKLFLFLFLSEATLYHFSVITNIC